MNIREAYNLIARDWHNDHVADSWWVNGVDTFISLLPKGSHVLDLGCGTGVKSTYLLNRGLQVTGIDISEQMIAIAKEEEPRGNFFVSDLYTIETLPTTYDSIFMEAVLLHVPKKDVLSRLQTVVEKIKSGGLLYVSVKQIKEDGAEEGVRREDDYGYTFERFFSYFTAIELRELFLRCGLMIVFESAHLSGKTTWLQCIGKKNL